jgi:phospholipid/cholesterol/gamma-HCH transport system permease protein
VSNLVSPPLGLGPPLALIGRATLSAASYLGSVAVLLGSALRAIPRRSEPAREPTLSALVLDELGWMLGMGLPLVGLVHVGLGSFLAMQSYYGGTFTEGTGAVVGVGLFRNVAAMMSGFTFAGLLASRLADGNRARVASTPAPVSAGRLVAGQLIAASAAGLVLALWGTGVGTVVGWRVAEGLMGVSTHSFFAMFWEMLWPLDVVGLAVKGISFGAVSALLAGHEGLRRAPGGDYRDVSRAACRAACLSGLAILVINSGWFLVLYHAGPAFGPTLLTPPAS